MLTYILRRLLLALPMIIGSSLIVFCIFEFSRIDPVRRMLGERSNNPEVVANLRKDFGLDRPAPERYLKFITGIFQGDFGKSMATRQPVADELRERFPATAELALFALILSAGGGLIFGIMAALKRNTIVDYTLMGVSLTAVSMPVFWLALMLSYFFSEKLGWFPLQQRYALTFSGEVDGPTGLLMIDTALAGNWAMFKDVAMHLVLPAVTLAAVTSALVARMTRSSVLEVIRQDFVRTAQAKGLRWFGVMKHILRNAMIPIVTIIGLEIPALLGGAVITETIFAWPGMGKYLVESILGGDIFAVQGVVMFLTLIFIVVNIGVDILYALIDPRLRSALADG